MKWRSSRSNNSATQATIYKRICVCESPRDKLCHKQNFMSKFEVSEFFRAFQDLDWSGLGTLDFATTFLSIHYDYRHKWYSIWKPVNRAFRHVKYRGKTRPACWVMDSWVSHWKQTKSGSFTGKMVDLAGYLFNHWANRDVLWNDGSWHIDSHYVKGVSGNMEYFRVKCALKCWYTVFYRVFPVWTRFARHSANTWNGDTKLGLWESSHVGLSDPQNSMS